MDHKIDERLTFTKDVYNYTICANMTKCCSPLQQGFALKQCFIVFGVQLLVPLFFVLDIGVTGYVFPSADGNAIRVICALLLHMIIYGEFKQALSVLRYLKYVKTARGGKRGRMINIILCTMQIISPIFTEVVLILAIGQTKELSMIIKSFVALGFVTKIDDMFSENFPKEIKDTCADMELSIGKDMNSGKKVLKRLRKSDKGCGQSYYTAFVNFLINTWYMSVNNFYIVIYYYFFPLSCVAIQIIAFYYIEV